MRILVAEDDLTSRSILIMILTRWGYTPVAVDNGLDAWGIMQRPDAPNLAILDWEMPGLDGLELCRKIRARPTSTPPYLIILTTRRDTGNIVTGLNAGANDYIAKPYNNDELHARIRTGKRMVDLQTELLAAKDALAFEASHDSLTGAMNRRGILERLDAELQRAQRSDTILTIGLCDIDHFKQVNDTHGHHVGDEVLCGFVATMKACLRSYDLLGRVGGEEFLVVAPDSKPLAEEGLYERLRAQTAAARTFTAAREVSITVSIGAVETDGSATADQLLAAADVALYRAKNAGRNTVAYVLDGRFRKKPLGQ